MIYWNQVSVLDPIYESWIEAKESLEQNSPYLRWLFLIQLDMWLYTELARLSKTCWDDWEKIIIGFLTVMWGEYKKTLKNPGDGSEE